MKGLRKCKWYWLLAVILLTMTILAGCGTQLEPSLEPKQEPSQSVMEQKIQDNLIVDFIDVGAADSILIRCGNQAMLIDGGDIGTEQIVLDYLKQKEIQELEYVVATHPHADHIGGLPDVLNEFKTNLVIMPKKVHTTKIYGKLLDAIETNNIPVAVQPAQGTEYQLGQAKFTVLAPLKEYEDFNNNSVVLKLTYGEVSILFVGDMEDKAESDLLASGIDLKADVLKVAHHGSETSSTPSFLEAVAPKYAIISANGENGNPDPQTLDRLATQKVEVFCTRELGTITLTTDGKEINIENQGIAGK